jgi:hypothetical protein
MYKKRQLLWRTIPSTLGAAASLIAVFAWVVVNMGNSVGATSTSFSFGTGGDHGNHADAQGVFEAAGQSGISFFQTNGDMSYLDSPTNNMSTATAEWCTMVNNKLGSTPFLALNGNHEEPGHGGTDGDNIDNIIANGCLPKPASMNVVESPLTTGSAGTTPTNYGREYYYDYPSVNPIARFIAVSADIDTYVGGNYDYSVGSAHYNWVQARIQEAKASGMWVIVVNHTPIMNTGGSHGGTDYSTVTPLFNLAVDEKVDLFLSGHEHNYQRSKQIGGASCNYTFNTYSANCIADANANTYTAGNGTIAVITGSTGGNYNTGDGLMVAINASDPDYQYFATTMGLGSANETRGFSKFVVTDTSITGSYEPGVGQTGGFTDTFTITRPDTTAPAVSLTAPVAGTVNGSISMTASASDAVGVTKVEFYQGATKLGEDLTAPYALVWDSASVSDGSYVLTAKAFDAAGNVTTSSPVTVTVDNTAEAPHSFVVPVANNDTQASVNIAGQCNSVSNSSEATSISLPGEQTLVTSAAFTLGCSASGQSANVTVDLKTKYDTAKLHIYKYANSKLTNIDSKVTIDNSGTSTVLSYSLVDGGTDDEDATANSVIVDPIYITTSDTGSQSLAETGMNMYILIAFSISVIGLATWLNIYSMKKR